MSSPPVLRPASAGSNRARPWIVVADGQRLRQLRRQRGMSQEALADRAGISVATVGRLDARTTLPAGAAPWPGSLPCSVSVPQPSCLRPTDRPEIHPAR
jgi:hypothetical protein